MLPGTVANIEMANPRSRKEREVIKKVELRWASRTPVCCSVGWQFINTEQPV